MNDLLSWLTEYSPGVVALIAFGAAVILILRVTVEKAVASRMDVYTQAATLRLGRRSTFEERVLTDRYEAFVDLTSRLQHIATDINRLRNGQAVDGFMQDNEIVPLTAVYEDLNIRRLLLGEKLHDLLREAARIALSMANYHHLPPEAYDELLVALGNLFDHQLRMAAEEEFGMSRIHW